MKLNFSLFQVFLLLISTLGFNVVFAQEKDSLPTRIVHLGLAYPISTNGQDAGNYSNGVSLHALVGVSGTERSVALSGLGNIIHQDARGAAVSGLFNYIGGSANGTQIAGLCNVNKGNSRGVQVAGLLNVQNRHTGVAMAGVGNTAVEHSGLQLAGVFNIAKITKGVQVSGLLNKSTHAQHQLAGLINIASKVEGVQIAGLINIADESDYPIGILNFIKNGEMQLGLSVDDMGSVLLNFRSGGRVTYGILSLGYNIDPSARYVLEGGIGMHFPMRKNLRLNAELSSSALSNLKSEVYQKSTAKVLGEWTLFPGFSVYAGPSLSYFGYEQGQKELGGQRYFWKERAAQHYNGILWGGTAGFQINL